MRIAKQMCRNDAIVVQDDMPVSSVIGRLVHDKKEAALVFEKDKLRGIFSPAAVFRSKVNVTDAKIGNFITTAPHMMQDADPKMLAEQIINHDISVLPVFRENNYECSVGIFDLLKDMAKNTPVTGLPVRSLMQDALAVREDEEFSSIINIFRTEGLCELPVVDNAGDYAGLITRMLVLERYYMRDVHHVSGKRNVGIDTRSTKLRRGSIISFPASNFMDPVQLIDISVGPDDTIDIVIDKMIKGKYHDIYVVQNESISGRVSAKDILKRMLSSENKKGNGANIRFIGFDKVTMKRTQLGRIRTLSLQYLERYSNVLRDVGELVIHAKEINNNGKNDKNYKYSVNARIACPGSVVSAKSIDWNVVTAVHNALEDLETETRRKFSGNGRKKTKTAEFYDATTQAAGEERS